MKLKLTLTSLVALTLLTGSAFAVPKPPLAAPIIACGTSTGSSINLTVTGGVNGAPAGFTVQWLTLDEYNANGWGSPLLCDASFSGMPQWSCLNSNCNAPIIHNNGRINLASNTRAPWESADPFCVAHRLTDCTAFDSFVPAHSAPLG